MAIKNHLAPLFLLCMFRAHVPRQVVGGESPRPFVRFHDIIVKKLFSSWEVLLRPGKEMPISAPQWRVNTGLINGSRGVRPNFWNTLHFGQPYGLRLINMCFYVMMASIIVGIVCLVRSLEINGFLNVLTGNNFYKLCRSKLG